MTETLPAVTAAREALARYDQWAGDLRAGTTDTEDWLAAATRDLLAVVDRLTHERDLAREDLETAWVRVERAEAKVDRLTAPPSEEEVEALRSVIAPLLAPYVSSPLDPIDVEIAAAIVAASGRRHLPTEPGQWEWGLISPDAVPGQYGSADRAHLVSRNREHIERQHRRGHPSIMLAHRRPAGPWEVCDEQ